MPATIHPLNLRAVTEADAELLFSWANDPESRQNAINTAPIEWETHLRWLKGRLQSNSVLLILESQAIPVGQVRFDFDQDEQAWVISYAIAPDHRGKGLGLTILEESIPLVNKFPLVAFVKPGNRASRRIFEKLSFSDLGIRITSGTELIKFVKDTP